MGCFVIRDWPRPRGAFSSCVCEILHTRRLRNLLLDDCARRASGAPSMPGSRSMSGDGRLNRKQTPSRSKIDLSIILLVLFALAGIAASLEVAHFNEWTSAQLLAP